MLDDPFNSMIRRHVFEKELKKRMSAYLGDAGAQNKSALTPILELLGCPYVKFDGGHTVVLWSAAPHRDNETLVTKTLIHLLETVVPIEGHFNAPEGTFSILAGLARKERWRQCLKSIDSAYLLAAGLVEFCLMEATSNAGARLREGVVLNVRHILENWINLRIPRREDPQPDVIATALFGPAWLHIAVGGDHPYFDIPDAIRGQRPPFLPGVVAVQAPVVGTALPELDTL